MLKKYFIIFILFLLNSGVFALPGSPMDGWSFSEFTTLNGKEFNMLSKSRDFLNTGKTLADSYREQSGYAVVNGQSVQFWLYDTITYHNGKAKDIYDDFVPYWVEHKGYVIDYDNIKIECPYNVPNSVKKLMQQRGCDTAVVLLHWFDNATVRSSDWVEIIEFLNSKNIYKKTTYPLVRQ
ncbi:MAG: hypothetical protein J6U56_08780 [Spirochaetia bacterium]|nr:hypothetical protein [Spirochaetia bacterium]